MDEQEFRASTKREGYLDPVLVEWDAGIFNDDHTHDLDAMVYVLSGEMTVTTPDWERTCHAGGDSALSAGVVHTERVGPDGVKFLLARK